MSQNRHEHAAGDVIHRHRHDDHQLVYVSQGVLAVSTEHGAWVASADRAVWIPAEVWHEHRAYGGTDVHTFSFSTTDPPLPSGEPTVIAVSALLRELLVACTEPDLPAAELARIRAVLHDRLRHAGVRPLTVPAARDPRLARACGLVIEDLGRPRTTSWLARQTGTSERTLARLFRTEFGMTYPQWRTNTRVFHAMIELTKGATVTQTAHRCGWATASAFVDTFTRTMGQTPGAYRAAATHTASARMAGVTTWPLTVNGHDWNVRDRVGEPGAYDYEWLTGPNPYGFSEKTSDGSPVSEAHMREAIADFLAQINPETGYLD